jgi:hypothetical protein
MIKFTIVESPTKPGPEYVRISRKMAKELREFQKRQDEYDAQWEIDAKILKEMIKEAEDDIAYRRSLGEDI